MRLGHMYGVLSDQQKYFRIPGARWPQAGHRAPDFLKLLWCRCQYVCLCVYVRMCVLPRGHE